MIKNNNILHPSLKEEPPGQVVQSPIKLAQYNPSVSQSSAV